MHPAWKNKATLHLVALLITAVCAAIGIVAIPVGFGTIILLPMLFSFVLGVAFNPNLTGVLARFLPPESAQLASRTASIAVLVLVAKFGTTIGPEIDKIASATPVLLLQEFGNLGTIALGFPVAVFLLHMKREAIGATYSIGREANLAIIADRYGLDSPEGAGVIGVYVVGTLLGAIVFAVMPPLLNATGIFSLESLAMSCGVGSISMFTVCTGSLVAIFPDNERLIVALGTASNLLTGATGFFLGVFVALPLAERLYRRYHSADHSGTARSKIVFGDRVGGMSEARSQSLAQLLLPLVASAGLGLLSSSIASSSSPVDGLVGIAILCGVAIMGISLASFVPLKLPAIAWTAFLMVLATLPISPISETILSFTASIDLIALGTVVLAYGGLSLTQREFAIARNSGWKIAIVAICLMVGTYLGSAIIAEIALRYIV
ncbi:DUF3100 domain-containing protein [Mesorhizobium sp. DCY119]|nr:DUF3100 domain-containing protein [Mesorhizobium sp. DCY119]